MYYRISDHNPPHVHARYGDYFAEIDIFTGEIIEGNLPIKAAVLVKEWVLLHKEELDDVWKTQVFKKIKPLE